MMAVRQNAKALSTASSALLIYLVAKTYRCANAVSTSAMLSFVEIRLRGAMMGFCTSPRMRGTARVAHHRNQFGMISTANAHLKYKINEFRTASPAVSKNLILNEFQLSQPWRRRPIKKRAVN